MRRENESADTDRGQAYTLEGIIGAMVVLMAVLFALQSVVITPTTGGAADRTVQAQIQQEVQDALVVAAGDDEGLSYMIRYWDGDGGFDGAEDPGPGDQDVYSVENFSDEDEGFALGEILDKRFTENGQSYNVELHYTEDGDPEEQYLVYQGSPSSSAVTASYTVALYDEQEVTSNSGGELRNADDETIPRLDGGQEELYNVVEVRVIVW